MVNKKPYLIRLKSSVFILTLSFLVLFESGLLRAQYNFVLKNNFSPKIDTLFFDHRSGGKQIDSLDKAYYDLFPTLFNVGRAYLPFFQPMKQWGSYRHFFSDERLVYRAAYHFTALPYTGFFYSFGSGGEQVLDLRYTQNVGKHFNLSFRYHRTMSDPSRTSFLMRNIEAQANDLSLNLHYNKDRLNSFLSVYYGFDNNRENFGLDGTNPNLINFPLEQIPVNNTIASAQVKRVQIELRNELDLSQDTTGNLKFVNSLGFHNFKRSYIDSLTFSSFNSWIYDSMKTNDIWEEPHLLMDNGLLLKRENFKAFAGFQFDYFTYFNRGIRTNRLDGIVLGSFQVEKEKLFWMNKLRFFIFGTPGEYNLNSTLKLKMSDLWSIGADFLHERIFPEFFQLNYRGNHFEYDYSAANISPTLRTFIEPYIGFGNKQRLQFSTAFLNVNNLYLFTGTGWNFTGNQNVISPIFSWKLRKGALGFNGKAQYFVGNKSDFFAPDYLITSRLFLDGAVFKDKKLKVATGVEVYYFDGYESLTYHPEVGVFGQLLNPQSMPNQNLLLNVFVNLQMDRFRFFLAANRINTLFESQVGAFVDGYPLRPFFIRMGIVWDFVN